MRRYIGYLTVLLWITVTTNLGFAESAFALFGKSKQEISKSCSKQADAKGLHGKARKVFRAKCKRHEGKVT
jgi:hypothetical protein